MAAWWRNDFGIDDIEQEYLKVKRQPNNEKYTNGSVGERVRLIVRGGCLRVRSFTGMEWKYADDMCECGTNETEIHLF